MTDTDRATMKSWADLLGDRRRTAAETPESPEGKAVSAEADRLESLIAFYKASVDDA